MITFRFTQYEVDVVHRAVMYRLMALQRETDENDTMEVANERYKLRQLLDLIAMKGSR